MKHEGATTVLSSDGRVVVYTGDDQTFEYLYKYVSARAYDPDNPARNRTLLDDGTLFVARLADDGGCTWVPLVFGRGPLTTENGFDSQADVLIETRRAADLLGATPLDRPEDIETNPLTGRVYGAFTNNLDRKPEDTDGVSTRGPNPHGYILEILHPGAERTFDDAAAARAGVDHTSSSARWEVFMRAGDPNDPTHDAMYHPDVSAAGWVSCPDNLAFDPQGRMWIATDQGTAQAEHGICDGMRACDTVGDGRALTRTFFACPVGAEMCGPCFTPDGTTLFVAVQHPADGNHADHSDETPHRSTFDDPTTRWPDNQDGVPRGRRSWPSRALTAA